MARNGRRATAIGWLDHQDPEKIRNIYIENEAEFDANGDILVAKILTGIAQKTSNIVVSGGTLRNWRSQVGLVVFKKRIHHERRPAGQILLQLG